MKYPRSDHYDGREFLNPENNIKKDFSDLLKWQFSREKKSWPAFHENRIKPILDFELKENQAGTIYINHATHFFEMGGLRFITDSVFSKRTSPVTWAGPQRVHPPALEIEALPPIDIVLVSHNHYDHMDVASIRKLQKLFEPLFITPLGNRKLLGPMGATRVIELDWWQSTKYKSSKGSETEIFLTPAQHWSARGIGDRNKALWGGFVVKNPFLQIYFAGDTGYGKLFFEINKNLGIMDLSFLPIGAYEPRWFMKEQHMNPDDAVKAHVDLKSRKTLGTHFGTFQLTDEGIDDPVLDLAKALQKYQVSSSFFSAPAVGQKDIIESSRP